MSTKTNVAEDFGIWPYLFFVGGAISFYGGGWLIYRRPGYRWLSVGVLLLLFGLALMIPV